MSGIGLGAPRQPEVGQSWPRLWAPLDSPLRVPCRHSPAAPESLGGRALSLGDTDARMFGELVPLISHIIFGISHSLGELENVIVKVFLNICLLSKKML